MAKRFSRRQFLKFSAVGLGSTMLVQCADYDPSVGPTELKPGDVVPCARTWVSQLQDLVVGQPVDFGYPLPTLPAFAVKLGEPAAGGIGPDGDVVAFSYLCTHMGCPILGGYNHEHKILGPCRCHFTTFSMRHRGQVVLGQATADLPQITLEVEGDDVLATGITGVIFGELSQRCSPAAGGTSA